MFYGGISDCKYDNLVWWIEAGAFYGQGPFHPAMTAWSHEVLHVYCCCVSLLMMMVIIIPMEVNVHNLFYMYHSRHLVRTLCYSLGNVSSKGLSNITEFPSNWISLLLPGGWRCHGQKQESLTEHVSRMNIYLSKLFFFLPYLWLCLTLPRFLSIYLLTSLCSLQ